MVKKMQAKQRRERAGAKMALPSPLTSRVITSRRFRRLVFVIFLFTMAAMQACAVCGCGTASGGIPAEAAGFELLGEKAAKEALRMLSIPVAPVAPGRLIVLSNAGYAEVGGQSAFGAQDGLAGIRGMRLSGDGPRPGLLPAVHCRSLGGGTFSYPQCGECQGRLPIHAFSRVRRENEAPALRK